MATIEINKNQSNTYSDKTNSILLIGHGETEYNNKQILLCNDIDEVEYNYGTSSDLYEAYKEAREITSCDIYTCNCFLFTDYIDILDKIREEYGFICPLFKFSEFYKNSSNKVYLAKLYSNIIRDRISQILFTDNHASLYENLEQFQKDMSNINYDFKNSPGVLSNGENLGFVLNVLKNYKFANVVLASVLVQADLKYYPQKNLGDVVFDLCNDDFYGQELIYFSYNSITNTTIENLLNYMSKPCPEKFIPVHLIIQKIRRALKFEKFKGKLFNKYTQIQFEDELVEIMNSFVDVLIQSYSVNKINYQKVADGDEIVIKIKIELTIEPYNSMEQFDFALEV